MELLLDWAIKHMYTHARAYTQREKNGMFSGVKIMPYAGLK